MFILYIMFFRWFFWIVNNCLGLWKEINYEKIDVYIVYWGNCCSFNSMWFKWWCKVIKKWWLENCINWEVKRGLGKVGKVSKRNVEEIR